jgi:hypothetical protein
MSSGPTGRTGLPQKVAASPVNARMVVRVHSLVKVASPRTRQEEDFVSVL